MAFQLIAQTDTKQHLNDSWKVEFYQDTETEIESIETIELVSDIKLIRGNGSAKNKFGYITHTKLDFIINDVNAFMENKLKNSPDYLFKAIVKKNNNVFFVGYVFSDLVKRPLREVDNKLNLTVYDGLNRIESFKDVQNLPGGVIRMTELVRSILNKLNFELSIYFYQNIYPLPIEISPVSPAYQTGVMVKDYLNEDGDTTYMEILQRLTKQMDYNVYQAEGFWQVRQNMSVTPSGAVKELVNYSTGGVTRSTNSPSVSVLRGDLEYDTNKFTTFPVNKIDFKVTDIKTRVIPTKEIISEMFGLKNPQFKEGGYGWTVETGNVLFRNGFCKIEPGGIVSQLSTETVEAGNKIIIIVKTTIVRYISNFDDYLPARDGVNAAYSPMFKICYVGDGSESTYSYNPYTNVWMYDPNENNNEFIYSEEFRGYRYMNSDGTTFTHYPDYVGKTQEKHLELIIPAEQGASSFGWPAKIKIKLYGGAALTYNLPQEITAQHREVFLKREIIGREEVATPRAFIASSKQTDSDQYDKIDVEIPFHDFDPFIQKHFWNMDTGVRSIYWGPNDKSLLKYIGEETIKFNAECKEAYDLRFLSGKAITFNNLISSDLDGEGTKYFLPVYEETLLIDDKKRFIVLQHQRKSTAVDYDYGYEF